MAHQALYRRWRAQTFGQIVGQEPVVTTLRNAVRRGEVAHALLFVGPRGTGKTSMARIVAKALNCTDLQDGEPCDRCPSCVAIREGRAFDVLEMDAASNNKVDDIRELLRAVATTPSDLRRKVFIVDEVQRIKEGWDVLLKTLEEPPDHVAFIFCTTDSSQIRPAVISRVQRFDFRRLTVAQIEGKLRAILEADGREAEPEAITLVARLAAGGMRDAESMLDQLLSSGADRLEAGQVRDLLGIAEAEAIEGFVEALVGGDGPAGLRLLDDLEERGRDLRVFLDQVVDTIRGALVEGLGGPASQRWPTAELVAAARRLASIDPQRQGPGGFRLQLELAVLSAPSQTEGVAAETTSRSPERAVQPEPAAQPGPAAQPEPPSAAPPPARSAGRRAAPSPNVEAASVPAEATPPPPPADLAPDAARAPAAEPSDGPMADPSATLPPGGDLAELLRQWPEIVALISQHPPTKPLISACRPIAVDVDVVTLGFPEGQAFLRDALERRRPHIEEGIGRFLGRPVAVRCVATNLDLPSAPTPDDDGTDLLSEARRIFADDLVDIGEVS
jgi:DNA polymerase III subunit gamma/tau